MKIENPTSWNHKHAARGENHGGVMNFEVHSAFNDIKYLTRESIMAVTWDNNLRMYYLSQFYLVYDLWAV